MSYLNSLSNEELQELIDISTTTELDRSQIINSLNNVLETKKIHSSGIMESLKESTPTYTESKNTLKQKVANVLKQVNEAEKHYLKNKQQKTKNKRSKLKKNERKIKRTHSVKNIANAYKRNPKIFYTQNLVKQNEKLKTQIERIKGQLQIQYAVDQNSKCSNHGFAEKIHKIQHEKIKVSDELKCLKTKYENLSASKERMKCVLEKIVLNNQMQKEEFEEEFACQQRKYLQMENALTLQTEEYKQQINLLKAMKTNQNKSKHRQSKHLSNKLNMLQNENEKYEQKCQILCDELRESELKNEDLCNKHKQELDCVMNQCHEYKLQFHGALRKMEFMIDEKKEIAKQFQTKCQIIEKLQQRLVSQEKMLRSLRSNMQGMTKQNTKDAMQCRINQLMKLSEQWDNIAVDAEK